MGWIAEFSAVCKAVRSGPLDLDDVPETLDELLAAFSASELRRRPARHPDIVCPCGRNPLLVYFNSGRQATREALVLAQAAMPSLAPGERDSSFADLEAIYGHIAHREIASFCAVCQFRQAAGSAPAYAEAR